MIKPVVRWLGNVPIVLVGDGGFACARLAWVCLKYKICLISRLKMNARLYDFSSTTESGRRGRKRTRGTKLISFKEMIEMPDLGWKEVIMESRGHFRGGPWQWSDKAIARTTPILMGLYTIVCLIANRLHEEKPIPVAQTAWYAKNDATFSDLLKAVGLVEG